MPKTPAAVSDRLEELEKRIDSIEKRQMPSANLLVGRFMMACLKRDDEAATACQDIFARYERWCREHYPSVQPLGNQAFTNQFAQLCKKAGLEMGNVDTFYCFGIAISA